MAIKTMKVSDPSAKYLQMRVEGANPMELIIMLYEGGIKFLHQAKEALRTKDYDAQCQSLLNAQAVIRELKNALDMRVTEISPRLASLYNYMLKQLIEANLQKKNSYIDEVLHMLTELKDVWIVVNQKEYVRQNKQAMNNLNVSITA